MTEFQLLALTLLVCFSHPVSGFVAPTANHESSASNSIASSSTLSMVSSLFSSLQKKKSEIKSNENGRDEDYPWCFTGRLWFRPAIVRVKDSNTQGLVDNNVSILNLFGYTIGGTVALEYDTSPVGPYKEYVSMGALVACPQSGMVGQWGSRLYVSTKTAEEICQEVWGVPAEVASIDFVEESALQVTSAPDPLATANTKPNIEVTGWAKTRVNDVTSPVRGGLPILWTPTVKALWAKLLPLPLRESAEDGLPVHKLRLSASSVSLQFCGQESSDLLGIPLGVGLSVDNVLIEIGRQEAVL